MSAVHSSLEKSSLLPSRMHSTRGVEIHPLFRRSPTVPLKTTGMVVVVPMILRAAMMDSDVNPNVSLTELDAAISFFLFFSFLFTLLCFFFDGRRRETRKKKNTYK